MLPSRKRSRPTHSPYAPASSSAPRPDPRRTPADTPACAAVRTFPSDALHRGTIRASSDELLTVKLRYKAPEGESSWLIEQPVRDRGVELGRTSDDFRFAAAVAEWGMLLRDSRFRGSSSWAATAALARGALGHDEHGYRAEFLRLVAESRRLAAGRDDREPSGRDR